MDGNDKFFCKWETFRNNLSESILDIRTSEEFFDVTIACDDEQLKAHKVILASSSPWFRSVLSRNPHAHPLIYLKGVKFNDLKSILTFIYNGEVNVQTADLKSFLDAAKDLNIKSLDDQHLGNEEALIDGKRENESTNSIDYVKELDGSKLENSFKELLNAAAIKVETDIDDSIAETMDANELEETLLTMIARIHDRENGNLWQCTICKKCHKNKTKITQHAETHLDGFEHKCKMCGVIKKTRNALQKHIGSKHKFVPQNE